MEDFNLIDNPWIWVTTTEGKIKQVSLHELFDLAGQISCLSNENVYVNASIFLLCFSVLYTAYSRNSETKNMSEDNFVYRKDVITDYLQSVHDLFNLYDPERPFMQVKEDFKVTSFYKNKEVDLQLGKGIDLRHLNVFDSSASKKSMWGLKNYDYSNDWIARQLVTYRQWHPNINDGPKGITVKASSFLNEYFSLLFIKGDTLSDQFCLNFKEINLEKDMHPIWEETPECENEYINNFISVFESKDNKGNISYSCYYDANLDDDLDVARLLTYSNVYLNINRNTNTFKRRYHLPIKLSEEKPDPDGKGKKVIDFSLLGSMISIFKGNCNRFIYSIQREILSDVYNETLKKAKYVSLIKSPTFVDEKKASFKNLFTEPIILVGNGLLKVDLKDDVSKNRLRDMLSGICDELESYDKDFKELASSIIKKIYTDANDITNKETLYTNSIKSASLYAEEQFFEFSSVIFDFLSDIPFLEKESSNMKRRIYSFYLKTYKQFIKQHCSKMYFCLDTTFNLRGISSMRTSDYIKIVSLNTYSCIKNSSRDLVKLRDMRHCKYIPTLTLDEYYPSGSKTSYVVGSKKSKYMLQGIQYALYLWSNHKYWTDGDNVEVVKDVEFIKDTTNYSNTFGGALGLLRKCYNKEDWENKCHKYEVASHNINNLVRFIYLTIKEMVDRNIEFKLDYGRLAYFFTLILENKSNIKEFCSETMEAFYKCTENDKKRT